MLRPPRWISRIGTIALLPAAALAYACGDANDDTSGAEPVPIGGDAGNSDSAFNRGTTCGSSADCNGGFCNAGVCCNSAAAACGATCCGEGSVCLFEQCVVPGAACTASTDCPNSQYCETALATQADAGATGTGTCSAPPPSGRCVEKPTICADGGTDAACVTSCEFKKPAGTFDVALKWEWGSALAANDYPNHVDVWSTPVVGRLRDGNCDGKLDDLDPPTVVFVSGDTRPEGAGPNDVGTCCHCTGKAQSACLTGVLRAVDGVTGKTIWSLARDSASPADLGFAGVSPAIGDIDGNGELEIVVATGDGHVAIVSASGSVLRRSDLPIENTLAQANGFGWGGGLAIADLDGDGAPEIVYGRSVFTTKGGGLTRSWVGTGGLGGARTTALSTVANVAPGDGGVDTMEIIAGRTVYAADGTILWDRKDLSPDGGTADGFPAVADLDKDGRPEIVIVSRGRVVVLDAKTGVTRAGPSILAPTSSDGGIDEGDLGHGGPPTIADFDGDGFPDIGVANSNHYFVQKTVRNSNGRVNGLAPLWSQPNHDLSSSQTGSTVFDFEGDGRAEVVYADECFLWVWGFDGTKPVVRLAIPTTSFTGTEASLVADVDGDGRAELLVAANRADPGAQGWKCNVSPWNAPDPQQNRPAWKSPAGTPNGTPYRGVRLFGDKENAWVGTRTLWNQHTYHVTNVCDPHDSACAPGEKYGAIPKKESASWKTPWVNSFRQNVQDQGIFEAADARVALRVECTTPARGRVEVRNGGLKTLPRGVRVGVFDTASGNKVTEVETQNPLLPGQTEVVAVTLAGAASEYVARIVIDPQNRTFRECREDNNESARVTASCAK